jgi:hypothetical protein
MQGFDLFDRFQKRRITWQRVFPGLLASIYYAFVTLKLFGLFGSFNWRERISLQIIDIGFSDSTLDLSLFAHYRPILPWSLLKKVIIVCPFWHVTGRYHSAKESDY